MTVAVDTENVGEEKMVFFENVSFSESFSEYQRTMPSINVTPQLVLMFLTLARWYVVGCCHQQEEELLGFAQ